MTEATKTVWILGAGFSKSLGGPLLDDLLTEHSLQQLSNSEFKEMFKWEAAKCAVLLYRDKEKLNIGRWRDVEHFIEYIGRAAAEPKGVQAGVLDGLVRRCFHEPVSHWEEKALVSDSTPAPLLQELYETVKLLVALENALFTAGFDQASERLSPYRDWATKLDGHTIATFNYDEVLNLAFWAASRRNALRIILPHMDMPALSEHRASECQAFHLHGNAFWTRGKDKEVVESYNEPSATPVMGTPGLGKAQAMIDLSRLWEEVGERIRNATHVLIVGCRLASHDAYVRKHIIGALRDNLQKRLRVDIVLGPDISYPDVRRVEGLVRAAAEAGNRREDGTLDKKLEIKTWPMYAEDFLGLWDPNQRGFRAPPI